MKKKKDDRYLFAILLFFDTYEAPGAVSRPRKMGTVLIPRNGRLWFFASCSNHYLHRCLTAEFVGFFCLDLLFDTIHSGVWCSSFLVTERSGDFKAHDKKS